MTLLVDSEISQRIAQPQSLAQGVDPTNNRAKDSPIQAASLDLTVGEIYIPGTEDSKPGGANSPLSDVTLNQGHTAVIRTRERLSLGDDLAGIAFPPASLSLKGLLTTNPGHIDPGYNGPLHLTVINMGRAPIALKAGERIMRVLFLVLTDKRPTTPYNARNMSSFTGNTTSIRTSQKISERISRAVSAALAELKSTAEGSGRREDNAVTSDLLLRRLSDDFLDIERRAKAIADTAVTKAQFWAILIPLAVAVLTLVGNYYLSVEPVSERVAKLEITQVQEHRLQKIEHDVAALKVWQPHKK